MTFAGQTGAPKLHCAYYGPYVIDEKVHDNAFKIRGLPDGVHPTQNVTNLRPFVETPERFRTRPRQPIPQPVPEGKPNHAISFCPIWARSILPLSTG